MNFLNWTAIGQGNTQNATNANVLVAGGGSQSITQLAQNQAQVTNTTTANNNSVFNVTI
jgi:hypothetical protein